MDNRGELCDSVRNFINVTQTTVEALKEMKKSIDTVYTVKSFVKGTSLLASILGGGLVIGAVTASFFTGGTSLVALTGAGTLLGLGGSAVNLSTDIIDMIYSKIRKLDLEEIVEKRKRAAERFSENFNVISQISEVLKNAGLSEEDASDIALLAFMIGYDAVKFQSEFTKIKSIFNDIMKKGSIEYKDAWILAVYAVKEGKSVHEVLNSCQTLRTKFGSLSKFSEGKSFYNGLLRSGGNFWKNMRLVSESLVNFLNIGKKAAMKIVKGSTVAISGLFMGFEIKEFIDVCKENHPLSNAISKLIETMEKELEVLKSLYAMVSA